MALTVDQFVRIANSSWFNKDVVLTGPGTLKSQFFHSKSSNAVSAETNRATLEAFKTTLSQTYGVFGEGAFQSVLKERLNNSQSLRAKDILATIQLVEQSLSKTQHAMVQQARYALGKAFALVPAYNALPEEAKAQVGEGALRLLREEFAQDKDGSALQTLTKMMEANPSALEEKLAALIRKAVATLPELADIKGLETLNKPWTKTHTQTYLLNLRDPATQEDLSKKFAVVVEKTRAQAPQSPIVTRWDKLHTQDGRWTSKEDFLEFARDFAEPLSIKETVEAERVLAEALKDASSPLTQKVKARFSRIFTPPAGSPEVEAAHRDLMVAKRESALAEAKWALIRAKNALSEAELRVKSAEDDAQRTMDLLKSKAREVAEADGNPREVLKEKYAEMAAQEKVMNEARERLDHLRSTLTPFMVQAEKRIAHLEREGAPEAEWLDMRPLLEMEPTLKGLRELLAPFETKLASADRTKLLKEALALEEVRSDCAKAKRHLLEQQTKSGLTELHVTQNALNRAAGKDPSLKALSTITKELIEAKQALQTEVASKAASMNAHFSAIAQAKETFSGSDSFEAMNEAVDNAREANDQLFEELAAAEPLSESIALSPNDVFASSTFLAEVKAHCFIEIRQAMA